MNCRTETEKNISDLKIAIHGNFITQGIAAACELGVFDHFENHDDVLTLEQLSDKTHSQSYSLNKLLNFLVTVDLLSILPDRQSYKITSKGTLLQKASKPSLHYFARLHSTHLFRGASDFLVQSIKNNKPGTSYFSEKDMFGYLGTNDEDSEVFNKAMGDLTSIHADEIGQFVKKIPANTVLDAGGGIGTVLCSILKHNPDACGIIVDLPNVKDAAFEYVSRWGYSNRVSFLAKSFFEEFHAVADIITLHHVLHDYDDEGCLTILKNCQKSLAKNGSILIIETLLGNDAAIGVGWLKDLIMHVITPGGRVRSQSDFQTILDRSNLEIRKVYQLTSSDLSILQVQKKNLDVVDGFDE